MEKQRKWQQCLFSGFIFLCAFVACYKMERTSSAVIAGVTLLALWLYRHVPIREQSPKTRRMCAVYTVMFSLALAVGKAVHYSGIMRGNRTENTLDISLSVLLGALALAVLLFPVMVAAACFVRTHPAKPFVRREKNCRLLLGVWAVIFVMWTPYLLSFYPAGIVGDGALALRQAMEPGVPSHAHWGVLHLYALKLFLWLGNVIKSSADFGVFLYAATQSLLFAGACAAVVYWVYRIGAPRWAVAGSVILYAASGFFASFGIAMWKDTLFSAAVMVCSLLLWKVYDSQTLRKSTAAALVLLTVFIGLWRNNGPFVVLFSLLLLLVVMRGNVGRKLLAGGAVCFALVMVIQGPFYSALGIQKDSISESSSVPLQQVAAVIGEDAPLTEEQEQVLYSLLPKEKWQEWYCPTLSDNIKDNLDKQYLQTHYGEFLRVWAQLLPGHFKTYVEAYLLQMLGYWQPGVWNGLYDDYWLGIQGTDWQGKDWFGLLTGHSFGEELARCCQFIPSGTMVWVMLFSLTLILVQPGEKRKRLVPIMPLLACWLTMLLAAPIAYAYRYILMLAVALPVFAALPFCHGEQHPDA